ncbi:MAG: methionyl-tRNA formyltransferase [Candidatus Saccharibacteria bacterium]
MRLIFMGTADFAVPCLHKLILSGYDIPLVVTQPDRPAGRGNKLQAPPVKTLAAEFGLDIIQPASVKSDEFFDEMRQAKPDVIVVVAYGRILPESILTLPPLGCINVHGSLLPKYRGAAPIQRSLMAGEEIIGVTTMYMDKTMDTGDMILQRSISLVGNENYGEIAVTLADIGSDLLLETLEQLEWRTAPRIPQNHGEATYAPPLAREDELIRWEMPARTIMNQIRGLSPSPGAYSRWRETKLKIFRAQAVAGKKGAPGEITDILPGTGFIVGTGDGALLVMEVQREGKNKIDAGEFLKGSNLKLHEFFGV